MASPSGARVGRVKKKGDWDLFYQFQRVEQESVFSAFVQDDFLLATNFRGHVGGMDYGLTDRLSVRAWALVARKLETQPGEDNDNQLRIRLDLNAKF